MTTAKTIKLLVVDDEPELADLVARNLELRGYQAMAVNTVADAVMALDQSDYDAVLSDVRMPVADGMELIATICNEARPQLNVFLMSAYTDITRANILDHGAMDIFAKPLNFKLIDATIRFFAVPIEQRYQSTQSAPANNILEARFNSLPEAESTNAFELGRGGFFLNTKAEDLKPGSELPFNISFANGSRTFSGSGKVVWTRSEPRAPFLAGYGIAFTSLDAASCASLKNELASRYRRPVVPIGIPNQYRT